jgi:hypothetical protein
MRFNALQPTGRTGRFPQPTGGEPSGLSDDLLTDVGDVVF